MNRIDKAFKRLNKKNKKAFVAYITAGDPDMARSTEIALSLKTAGINILELGVPFSDPLADGIVNQMAAQRALASGTSLKKILEMVLSLQKDLDIPIILFTYFNPILKYGIERFSKDASHAGVDGVLILDLPPEEGVQVRRLIKQHHMHVIYLIAPTSTNKRIKYITDKASGFIYYVSRTGVTGLRSDLSKEIAGKVAYIKSLTNVPVVVGFGVSNREHVNQAANVSDGVVVGSAIVKQIEQNKDKEDLIQSVSDFVKNLVEGMP